MSKKNFSCVNNASFLLCAFSLICFADTCFSQQEPQKLIIPKKFLVVMRKIGEPESKEYYLPSRELPHIKDKSIVCTQEEEYFFYTVYGYISLDNQNAIDIELTFKLQNKEDTEVLAVTRNGQDVTHKSAFVNYALKSIKDDAKKSDVICF